MEDGIKVFAGDEPEERLSEEEQERFLHREREIETAAGAIETASGAIGEALLEISEERLYREQYTSFDRYIKERWGLKRSTAYEHIAAARVRLAIGDIELGRSQCVAIAVLPEELWEQAAREAVGQTVAATKRLVSRHKPKATRSGGSVADDLLPRVGEHRRRPDVDVPPVLKAVWEAAEALHGLNASLLGEELDQEQTEELLVCVAFIRGRLALLDACRLGQLSLVGS